MDDLERFVAELNRKIEASGKSNKEIAEVCEIHESYISIVRRGKRYPSGKVMLKLIRLLKLKL